MINIILFTALCGSVGVWESSLGHYTPSGHEATEGLIYSSPRVVAVGLSRLFAGASLFFHQ